MRFEVATPLISREGALAQGLKRYFTGDPCKRGHVAERFVANNYCVQCAQITERKRRGTTDESAERRRRASTERTQAQQRGDLRYFTGVPCKHGHVAERATKNGHCLECGRLAQLARYRDEPEKYRAITKDHYATNRAEIRARRNAEYAADPELGRLRAKNYRQSLGPARRLELGKAQYSKHRLARTAAARAYRQANPEKVKESSRAYNETEHGKRVRRSWREDHKELLNQRVREARAKDPERRRNSYRKWAQKEESEAVIVANAHRRRARLLAAPGEHTAADLAEILQAQGHRCAYCRADLKRAKKHVDHIVPLARGGSNGRANLQYLCAPCNQSKSARDPADFARSIGLLV